MEDNSKKVAVRKIIREAGGARAETIALIDMSLANTDIPWLAAYLTSLGSLRMLNLSRNDLNDVKALGEGLQDIRSLEWLNLASNGLRDAEALGGALRELRFLKILGLGGNRLSDGKALGDALRELRLLETLELYDNRLRDLKALGEALRELRLLRSLNLASNDLRDATALGEGLRDIGWLEELDLANNGLNDAQALGEGLRELRLLKTLNLSHNCLSGAESCMELLRGLLPSEVTQSNNGGCLRELYIAGNKSLGLDDQQLNKTNAAEIYQDLLRLLKLDQRPLHEVKVVILGDGEVGKSNLRDRLMYRERPNTRDRTHDWEVEELSLSVPRSGSLGSDSVVFRLFDFGGQPALHGAHRFYLSSSRNIYILVIKCGGTSRVESRIDYWARLTAFHGHGAAPALVVLSWCDLNVDQAEWGALTGEKLSKINPHFPFPVHVLRNYSDRLSTPGVRAVKDMLVQIASKMEYVFAVKYEHGFFKLKAWLQAQPKEEWGFDSPPFEKHVLIEQFRRNCTAVGIGDPDRQLEVLRIFGDLGLVQYVGEMPGVGDTPGRALREWVMNPQWVKGPVYSVIRDMPLAQTHGVVSLARLRGWILSRHPDINTTEADNLLALMEVCGLIFSMNSGGDVKEYLVVDQLPASGPGAVIAEPYENWGKEEVLDCEFLGEHVLPRLVGEWRDRLLDLTSHTFRDRAVFTLDTDRSVNVLVKADVVRSQIRVRTRAPNNGAKTKQERLRKELEYKIREIMTEVGAVMGMGTEDLVLESPWFKASPSAEQDEIVAWALGERKEPRYIWLRIYLLEHPGATLREIAEAAKPYGFELSKSIIETVLRREPWIGKLAQKKGGGKTTINSDSGNIDKMNSERGY